MRAFLDKVRATWLIANNVSQLRLFRVGLSSCPLYPVGLFLLCLRPWSAHGTPIEGPEASTESSVSVFHKCFIFFAVKHGHIRKGTTTTRSLTTLIKGGKRALCNFIRYNPPSSCQFQQRKHLDKSCPLVKTSWSPNTWSRYKIYYFQETEIQTTNSRNAFSKCCLLDMLILN